MQRGPSFCSGGTVPANGVGRPRAGGLGSARGRFLPLKNIDGIISVPFGCVVCIAGAYRAVVPHVNGARIVPFWYTGRV